jgi:hypothetical protein
MDQYFDIFTCTEDIIRDFEAPSDALVNATVIAAIYTQESYEGCAMVVFRKEGKLYEVHGSHCSCNGLEGQWSPEETTMEALMDRLEKTEEYQIERFGKEFASALKRGLIDEIFEKEVLLK